MSLMMMGLFLSSLDAGFTVRLTGQFSELNPLLRSLLPTPFLFVIVKTALAMVALGKLASMKRSRLAGATLLAGLGFYAVVDAYWIFRVLT
jgi:hypothetical protein